MPDPWTQVWRDDMNDGGSPRSGSAERTSVTVVLLPGGLPSTAVTPVEILGSAGVLWNELRGDEPAPRFEVTTASAGGDPVDTPVALSLPVERSIEEVESTDLVVLASGSGDLDTDLESGAHVIPWLHSRREDGSAIAAVCSGVPLVAEAGLLDDRPATTHWAMAEECRRRYPTVRWYPERAVTEADGVFCSGGVYSAIDLSLYLVERYCGHAIAMQTARALLLQTPRTWQAGYTATPPKITHEDERIRAAQEWLFDHFGEDVRLEELASRVNMSSRNFSRRFKAATGESPIRYLQRLRINAARHLLENELKTVRRVSREVGYEDLSFFRRLFKRHTGKSPRQYRERFGSSLPRSVAVEGRTPQT